MHLDHRIPKAAGGTDDPANLQWVHRGCHSAKTNRHDGGFGNRTATEGGFGGYGVRTLGHGGENRAGGLARNLGPNGVSRKEGVE